MSYELNNSHSPAFAKISMATAISLGLARGRMYRGAVNRCVNLLVHYPEGCSANCAYCGLAKKRPGTYQEKSFIHVPWPMYTFDEIVDAVNQAPAYVQRICISMITNSKCRSHTIEMAKRLSLETPLPVSVLLSPTILEERDLSRLKHAGVDKIGVALDLATPQLFEAYRGKPVSGPHNWEKYWQMIEAGLRVFGQLNVGAHLMVGMGETELQMVSLIQRLWDKGVLSHLFSFFAEKASALSGMPQPPWPVYLRVQLVRYLIEEGLGRSEHMTFDRQGRVVDFGIAQEKLSEVISSGLPFMTSGCLGPDGRVACNRPFGNCLPDVRQWNYPYPPNEEELDLVRESLKPTQKGFENGSGS